MAVERVVTFTSLNERLPDFCFFDQVALLGSCPHYLGLVLSPINLLWVELAGEGQNRARESSAQRSRWYSNSSPSPLTQQYRHVHSHLEGHFTAVSPVPTQERDVLTPNVFRQELVDNPHWGIGPKDACSKEGEDLLEI